jgi:hypothetical protein
MSALPAKADIKCRGSHVRLVPKATIAVQQIALLVDYLVGRRDPLFGGIAKEIKRSNLFLGYNIHSFSDIACLIIVVGYDWKFNEIRLGHTSIYETLTYLLF